MVLAFGGPRLPDEIGIRARWAQLIGGVGPPFKVGVWRFDMPELIRSISASLLRVNCVGGTLLGPLPRVIFL